MKSPLISVIIPVYNAEEFLPRCLDSILSQDYENLEIICINDGSVDGSLPILEQAAEKDGRIKILSQENKGQSAARNRGIKEAGGDYISFVDADDYIKEGLYSFAAEKVETDEPDIFMFNGDIVNSSNLSSFFSSSIFADKVEENEVFDYRKIKNYFYGNQSICNKIYRRDFLLDNNLQMIEGKIFEDTHFNFVTLIKAQKIKYTSQSFYVYCNDNENSTTKTFTQNSFGLFDVFEEMEKVVKQENLWPFFRYAIFQLEFEKLIETLAMTDRKFQENFYTDCQQFLTRKLFLLSENIYKQLVDFNLCQYLLNYSYREFRDLVLLEQGKNKGSTPESVVPMFSVIVPVYNVTPYLPRCLKSLQQQSIGDFEVICVNDGSTDGSGAIAEEYAGKDKRIKVLHQSNMGLGAARNNGVVAAKGEYIIFLDSDDWLAVDALEKMKETIEKSNYPDVGLFGFERYISQKNAFAVDRNIDLFPKLPTFDFHKMVDVMYLHPCAWNKFYRRDFFEKNNFKFPTKVVFEDLLIHTQVMVQAQSISVCAYNLYYYNIRQGSIMNSVMDDKKLKDLKTAAKTTLSYLKEQGFYEELKYSFGTFIKNAFNQQLGRMGEKQREKILQDIYKDEAIKGVLKEVV